MSRHQPCRNDPPRHARVEASPGVHVSQDIPYADGSNHSVDSLDTLNLDSPNKPHDKKERILKSWSPHCLTEKRAYTATLKEAQPDEPHPSAEHFKQPTNVSS
jgi:hypothetical protein